MKIASNILKTDQVFFDLMQKDRMSYNIRLNDRDFKLGESIAFAETVNEDVGAKSYTGRLLRGFVNAVVDADQGMPGIKDGYVGLSLQLDRGNDIEAEVIVYHVDRDRLWFQPLPMKAPDEKGKASVTLDYQKVGSQDVIRGATTMREATCNLLTQRLDTFYNGLCLDLLTGKDDE